MLLEILAAYLIFTFPLAVALGRLLRDSREQQEALDAEWAALYAQPEGTHK